MKRVLFITSDLGASVKVNGVRVVSKLNNTNHFIERLQDYTTRGANFVFIASNPNSHEINDSYAKLTFDSFNMSGFKFENLQIVDSRTKTDVKQIVKNATVVFLAGGDTLGEMEFFEEIGLPSLLSHYNGVVIGQSAGAINLAKNAYCSPEDEDELDAKRYYKGLGLTDISIEPHFKNSPHFGTQDVLQKILLEDSKKKPFIAITDGSFIVDDGKTQVLYGEGYCFKNGAYKQICSNGNTLRVGQDCENA